MARKRTKVKVDAIDDQYDKALPKAIWHPMNLQQMPPSKFVDVVNRILKGTHSMIAGSLSGTSSLRDDDGA